MTFSNLGKFIKDGNFFEYIYSHLGGNSSVTTFTLLFLLIFLKAKTKKVIIEVMCVKFERHN